MALPFTPVPKCKWMYEDFNLIYNSEGDINETEFYQSDILIIRGNKLY